MNELNKNSISLLSFVTHYLLKTLFFVVNNLLNMFMPMKNVIKHLHI